MPNETQSGAMRRVADDIDQLLHLAQSIRSRKDNDEHIVAKLDGITHLAFLYQAEICVHCKDWDRLSGCINVCTLPYVFLGPVANLFRLSARIPKSRWLHMKLSQIYW